jgi:plastocyanin
MSPAVHRFLVFVAFVALACTQEKAPDRGPASPTPAPGVAASVSGEVLFRGDLPAPTELRMTGDCAGTVSGQDVQVAHGKLANAFVYVREGLEGVVFGRPQEPVVVDQLGCVFVPHVIGVQSGQPITFKNSDPTLHNVHTMPDKSRAANFGLGVKGASRTIQFGSPEVMVTVKCDVHPWMRAFIGVLDHPHFAVTGADGTFRFENLPPGDYVIESWHERFGRREAALKLADGQSTTITLEYTAD